MTKRILCLFADRGAMMEAKAERIAKLEAQGTMINWSDDHVKAKVSINSADEIVYEYKTVLIDVNAGPLQDYEHIEADHFIDALHEKVELIDSYNKKEEEPAKPEPVEAPAPAPEPVQEKQVEKEEKPAENTETPPEATEAPESTEEAKPDPSTTEAPEKEKKPAEKSEEDKK